MIHLLWANCIILLVACNKQDNPPDKIKTIFFGTLITSNGAMSAEGRANAPMKMACILGRISKLVPEAAYNLEATIILIIKNYMLCAYITVPLKM